MTDEPIPQGKDVPISIFADKEKNLIIVQFAENIKWFELTPIKCAEMIRYLGLKLKELS